MDNQTNTNLFRKANPTVLQSFPRVIFRVCRENVLRAYDPIKQKNLNACFEVDQVIAVKNCQWFIDTYCRAFVRLDGYNPLTKQFKSAEIISKEVDHFFCEHPLINIE